MAKLIGAGKVPARVAASATQAGALDTNAMSLLGVFGPAGKMKAMVRLPGGRIKTVQNGSRLESGRIVAIDKDGVMVHRTGSTKRIQIPGD
ncbi:hypothetical protein [Primorskyibacter sp. S87]|uniref:hypothetical protein n=1 Tax=Primorskyibacter sp. S87 TaxID=3415126 RepID=UPI003C7E9054